MCVIQQFHLTFVLIFSYQQKMQLIKQKLKDTANSAQESDVQVGQMVSTPEIVLHQ
jgi:hypothetical protein